MKLPLLVVSTLLAALTAQAQRPTVTATNGVIRVDGTTIDEVTFTSSPSDLRCDPALQKHVYHSKRLKIIDPCVTVTGKIVLEKAEPDGDIHTRVMLDKQFRTSKFLNQRNIDIQGGALVVEPVCVNKPKSKPALLACGKFRMPKPPPVGSRVEVTGPLVLDTSPNHGWVEIHTAQIRVIP